MPDTAELFDLQVLFTPQEDSIWVSAISRLGAALALPVPAAPTAAFRNAADPTGWFRQTVAAGKRDPKRAEMIGGLLRDVAFGCDEIGSLLRRTRGAAAAEARPVILRLFVAPTTAAALPWELLLDPDDATRPLALAPDIHLARTAQVRTYALRTEPVTPPLNLLLVLSNPTVEDETSGATVFDHYEERRLLLAELKPLMDRGLLEVTVEDRPSLDNIRRRIGGEPRGFHAVHYLGHALPDQLKLETPTGEPCWVSSALVDELLRRGCPDLRLVVFAGCQTAVAPSGAPPVGQRMASSIADHSVQEACPSVVGMQAVLSAGTERVLTRVFYQALCGGRSIAHALTLARAAVQRDELVGRDQLEWAVPILVTGDLAGPIFDPTAPPAPLRPTVERTQLKLDLEEPDREFFARFRELRTILDVLTCRRRERVVLVTGGSGVGKSRLLARALDELDADVGYVLYLRAERLGRPSKAATVDPLLVLCEYVAELLGRGNPPALECDPAWDSAAWWERLVEELVDAPLVLAIEDIDQVPASVSGPIVGAVEALVKRRSRSRVALTSQQAQTELLGGAARYAVPVGLTSLSDRDVNNWVVRNRPGLATTLSAFPSMLERLFHTKLSSRLELWSAMATRLADVRLPNEADIDAAADWAVAQFPEVSSPTPVVPEGSVGTTPPPPPGARARGGPLRVVVAGPHLIGRNAQFAEAMAQIAAAHGISGRVVTGDGPDQQTSVATLLDAGSPFDQGGADEDRMAEWIQAAAALDPDVVLLDYGGPTNDPHQAALLRDLAAAGALLVAAGGNSGDRSWPAQLPYVFAVGALDDKEVAREYSPWFARDAKPDLYARDNLEGDPLATAVLVDLPSKGTSFAALRVLVAAVLVWAVDRSRTAEEVRAFLVESGTPMTSDRRRRRHPKKLNLDAALAAARSTVVLSALRFGPLDPSALGVASGLEQEVATALVQTLEERNVVESSAGRYQLTSPGDDAIDPETLARALASSPASPS